jgi:hypothetical protein
MVLFSTPVLFLSSRVARVLNALQSATTVAAIVAAMSEKVSYKIHRHDSRVFIIFLT